jgi:release factor glutamine methyltransferase
MTNETLPAEGIARFRALVDRRALGEPLAYLTGVKGFYDIELRVTRDVLVPRPETEILAEWAVARARARRGARVLDVGTGSGALALVCARHVPDALAHATDVSVDALRVASDNARRLGLADRVTWHQADLLPDTPSTFDVVMANLPYVGDHEKADVADDVLAWEPHVALFGGGDGLDVVRRLLGLLPSRLAHDADVGLEIGWQQAAEAVRLVEDALEGATVGLHRDLAGHPRMVAAHCGARARS